MKKILLFTLLLVVGYCTKAQTITINNTTSNVIMAPELHAGNPGSCTITYGTLFLPSIAPGGSVTYLPSSSIWIAPFPRGGVKWIACDLKQDGSGCGGIGGTATVGSAICGFPILNTSLISVCPPYSTITLTWYEDIFGNVTITIS